ncbi:hypothetical protein Peur_066879 [Populus x canadensis]
MDSMASCKLGLSVVCLNVNSGMTNICDGNEFYFVILYMRVCMCMCMCMCMHEKLAYFRIKELKDILSLLGLSKQGKKQDLMDRVIGLLSDNEKCYCLPLVLLVKTGVHQQGNQPIMDEMLLVQIEKQQGTKSIAEIT